MDTRESFLESLFEFDAEELADWHRFRSSPDKRRFLRFIDAFFKWSRKQQQSSSCLASVPEDCEAACDRASLCQTAEIVQDDDDASAPSLSTRASTFGDSSLGAWMARRSHPRVQSSESSVGWTSISEMTPTVNSVCSAPLPMARLQFRSHRRGIAINRRLWRAPDAHVASAALPTDQFPDDRRLVTMQMRAFGRPPAKGVAVDGRSGMLRGIFRISQFPAILRFLASETSSNRESHVAVFRALHALRRTSHYKTTAGISYDLHEDARLWLPKRAKPALTPYQLFASKIPVGTLAATISDILNEGLSQTDAQTDAPVPRTAAVEEDGLSELTSSDATHVTLEY